MSLLNTVLQFSDQELIPDIRPEEVPNENPFGTTETEEDRRSDEEVWNEEDEEESEEE